MGNVIDFKYPEKTVSNVCLIGYGDGHFTLTVPYELQGQGIKSHNFRDKIIRGTIWHDYVVTERALNKLKEQYLLINQAYVTIRIIYFWHTIIMLYICSNITLSTAKL